LIVAFPQLTERQSYRAVTPLQPDLTAIESIFSAHFNTRPRQLSGIAQNQCLGRHPLRCYGRHLAAFHHLADPLSDRSLQLIWEQGSE
jgi:hypothetical protein